MTGLLRWIMGVNHILEYGVCDVEGLTEWGKHISDWDRIPPSPASVICAVFPHDTDTDDAQTQQQGTAMLDCTASALQKALGYEFVTFWDGAPFSLDMAAALCGLGIVNDAGHLYTERWGCFCTVGAIVTNLRIPPLRSAASHSPYGKEFFQTTVHAARPTAHVPVECLSGSRIPRANG